MHTLRITLIGLILLSLFVFVATQINRRKNRPAVDGAYLFIWVWLVASITNFCVGVFIVGYSALTELGVHVVCLRPACRSGVVPVAQISRRKRKGTTLCDCYVD